jgi:hypothetical protein
LWIANSVLAIEYEGRRPFMIIDRWLGTRFRIERRKPQGWRLSVPIEVKILVIKSIKINQFNFECFDA